MNVLIVSIVGGVLCLDRIFVQALISRPIVAAPVIGMILGDPYTGLIAGAFIELFWIDRLPVGIGVMTWVYPRLAPWIIRGLNLVYGLIPLIGAAVALNTVNLRGTLPIFCAVFLMMTVILHYIRYV